MTRRIPFIRPFVPTGYWLNGKQSAFADLLNAEAVYPPFEAIVPVTIDLFPTNAVTHTQADYNDFHSDLAAILRAQRVRFDNLQAPLEVLLFNKDHIQYQHDFLWHNDFIAFWLSIKLPIDPSDPDAVVLTYYGASESPDESFDFPPQIYEAAPFIKIEVEGGCVVDWNTNVADLEVTVIDHDVDGDEEDYPPTEYRMRLVSESDLAEGADANEQTSGCEQLFTEGEAEDNDIADYFANHRREIENRAISDMDGDDE